MILNLAEAAELVGAPVATVRTWVQRGHLHKIPGSRPIMFRQEDVQDTAYKLTSQARHARLDKMWQQTKEEAEP